MRSSRICPVAVAVLLTWILIIVPGTATRAGFLDSVGDALKKTGKDISKGVKQVGEEVGIVDKKKSGSSSKPSVEKKSAASAPQKLPGGVSSRLKKISDELDKGRSALKKGAGSKVDRAKRAETHLNRAKGYQAEIEKKYAGQYSQDHPDVKSVYDDLEALAVDIEIALLESDGAPSETASAPKKAAPKTAATTPASAAPAEKLPGGVANRLEKMQKEMDKAEMALEKGGGTGVDRARRAEHHLKRAKGYQEEIEKRYAGQYSADHPEVAATLGRMAKLEAGVETAGQEAESAESAKKEARAAEKAAAAKAESDRQAAKNAKAEAAAAAKQQAADDCDGWNGRLKPYTEGDQALYACIGASDDKMPGCIDSYNESTVLLDEFEQSATAANPCGGLKSTLSDLKRYRTNFEPVIKRYEKKQAAAKANRGEIVFSTDPIDPANPDDLTRRFEAGDTIYGLIRTTKPWSAIYKNDKSADVRVDVELDGKKIHAQFLLLRNPELLKRQFLLFEVAPNPRKMTAYSTPGIEYGKSSATMRQGPNELTHHLGQLAPGKHTMAFVVQNYGTVWAAGDFTVEGKKFGAYAKLHTKIAEGVSQAVTLPPAKMANKKMAAEMKALLENAGWSNIHRINIVDKDWWLDRVAGGNSMVKSRHMAAAALAKGDDGNYFYRVCTFHQDRLLSGGFGKLYLSHQGDKVPVPKKNIDK